MVDWSAGNGWMLLQGFGLNILFKDLNLDLLKVLGKINMFLPMVVKTGDFSC